MKKSEIAIRDLNGVVRVSNLPSRDQLARAIDDFGASAKEATRYLSRLGSGVGDAVDSIVAMDNYAIRTLEAIERNQQPFYQLVAAISPFGTQDLSRTALVKTFDQVAKVLETNLIRLIGVSTGAMVALDRLDSQLNLIHQITVRDQVAIGTMHEEVLFRLWTQLGGNKVQVESMKGHLMLLAAVGCYRRNAAENVGKAIVELEKLSADLDILRERVAAPSIAGEDAIPIEVHLEALRSAVVRLAEGADRGRIKG
ncbi:hypothetical protein M408DRAFT_333980 [Serendipita vermifera MAFF 305830]|uniref:Uncharacterized protein n=1 Tax=Serendipita vermifera MAFF 305830 TaxID=933852 RepID=A0A0C2W1N5_SERVB|nr:hypothetical protein M408DRAFT_333980 [Serendipita vermifera MAFF 305830]